MYSLGAFCESPGKPWHGQACSFNSSTCGGFVQDCHGRGPGFRVSDFESNRLIGSYQFEGAKKIMEQQSLTSISGPVRAVHTYVDMSKYSFTLANGTNVQTCPPAMGRFEHLSSHFLSSYDAPQDTPSLQELPTGRVSPTLHKAAPLQFRYGKLSK